MPTPKETALKERFFNLISAARPRPKRAEFGIITNPPHFFEHFFDIHDAMLPEGALPLIYMIGFLILYFTGPGRYSLDYLIDTRIKKDLDETAQKV